jgi:hypothetical protein
MEEFNDTEIAYITTDPEYECDESAGCGGCLFVLIFFLFAPVLPIVLILI